MISFHLKGLTGTPSSSAVPSFPYFTEVLAQMTQVLSGGEDPNFGSDVGTDDATCVGRGYEEIYYSRCEALWETRAGSKQVWNGLKSREGLLAVALMVGGLWAGVGLVKFELPTRAKGGSTRLSSPPPLTCVSRGGRRDGAWKLSGVQHQKWGQPFISALFSDHHLALLGFILKVYSSDCCSPH